MYEHLTSEQTKDTKKKATNPSKRPHASIESQSNRTGIPDRMKSDFEAMSGFSYDNVRISYNSDKPARLGALAYTMGNEVYIGRGQEKHLGHELWHVAQQKRGAVRANKEIAGIPVNDQSHLEKAADNAAARSSFRNAPISEFSHGKKQGDVAQLIVPVRQTSVNCGMYAMGMALFDLGVTEGGDNGVRVAEALHKYAVAKGYSAMGEAFDAENLVNATRGFLYEELKRDDIDVGLARFESFEEMNAIAEKATPSRCYVLIPYFADVDSNPALYAMPGETGGQIPMAPPKEMSRAHWSVIEKEAKTGKLQFFEGNNTVPRDLGGMSRRMFEGNQSLGDWFDWTSFFEQAAGGELEEAEEEVIKAEVTKLLDSYKGSSYPPPEIRAKSQVPRREGGGEDYKRYAMIYREAFFKSKRWEEALKTRFPGYNVPPAKLSDREPKPHVYEGVKLRGYAVVVSIG